MALSIEPLIASYVDQVNTPGLTRQDMNAGCGIFFFIKSFAFPNDMYISGLPANLSHISWT